MQEFLSLHYEWLRALHLIAVMSWMAGMLYLPRLFVYHVEKPENSEVFKVMERRLLRFIMNPAMIVSWVLGLLMIYANPGMMEGGWMHTKLLAVLLMSGCHGFLAGCMKKFAGDANEQSAKFYRIINEVPTVLMILIVVMAVVQPF